MITEQMVQPARSVERGEWPQACDKFLVNEFIEAVQVRPNFHPIIDLFTGSVLGFEVLSRGVFPFETPGKMFEEARRLDATWDLEKACRVAALKKIATLPESFRSSQYFINVSPDVFTDPRFIERFTQARLQEYGVDQRQIVIEITEKMTFSDYRHFEQLVSRYTAQGFKIALDDFGSGYSYKVLIEEATLQP